MKNILFSTLLLVSSICFAQEEMETDRPDQTECSSVVKSGCIQLETGVIYSTDYSNNATSNAFNYATSLIRIGVFKSAELRLEIGEYEKTNFFENKNRFSVEGFTPLVLGTKIAVTEERGFVPQIAFIGHIELPLGDKKFINKNEILPSFRFSLSHSLLPKLNVGYNLGMEWGNGSLSPKYIYTFTIAFDIGKKAGIFIETFGDFSNYIYPESYFDCGITYLLFKNFQLDISAGSALNENSTDFFANAGFSLRLPN